MATLYTHQASNNAKTWALFGVFVVVVIGVGWLLSVYFDSPNVLYVAVIFSLVMNVAGYWWSDKLVLKMARAKPAMRSGFFDLYTVTENLSIAAGLPMPKLYVIEDMALNAFATGRDRKHSAVAVTTGLLACLERNELEGVIAHELAHIGNRDMLLSTAAVVLVGFVSIASDMILRSGLHGRSNRDSRAGGLLMLGVFIAGLLAPLVASLLHLAISRRREYLADATGALLTRYPEGLASALEKISVSVVPLKTANSATAHLYIANPFGGATKRFTGLLATHPPVAERIRLLREMSL
ncbi:MAG: M48 family metallopeptidase [Candidatus Vogelbacteria bacterium]|nr:M48 family metallopeptidase [Candidatus Vogelbacteria bacterium]